MKQLRNPENLQWYEAATSEQYVFQWIFFSAHMFCPQLSGLRVLIVIFNFLRSVTRCVITQSYKCRVKRDRGAPHDIEISPGMRAFCFSSHPTRSSITGIAHRFSMLHPLFRGITLSVVIFALFLSYSALKICFEIPRNNRYHWGISWNSCNIQYPPEPSVDQMMRQYLEMTHPLF